MAADSESVFREAAQGALTLFPVAARKLELVSIAENVSFRVASDEGEFVLRLHRPGYNTLAELESERLWVDALADTGLRVQRSLRTHGGAHFCSVELPTRKEIRKAGMTSWLAGEPLANSLEDASLSGWRGRRFEQIGGLAAALHNHAAAWQAPAGFTRPLLDSEGLLGEAPRWGRFWEHPALTSSQRSLLLATRALMQQQLRDYGAGHDNFGLIHADLHADNLLLTGDGLGLIDFDDAAYGWFVYDLATALVEYWGDADYPQLRAALLRGYRERRELRSRDEAMLDTFVLLRGLAVIGWFYQRPEHAGSDYFPRILGRVLATCARLADDGEFGG